MLAENNYQLFLKLKLVLKGLKSKLGYIKNEVKADTLSVSFLQQEVNEVNPSTLGSFTSITPQLGTIDDFKDLVKAANKMGNTYDLKFK